MTALGAPIKVLFVSLLSGIGVSVPLLFVAYLAPLIVYNVDYHKSLDKDMATNPDRSLYLAGKAGIYPYLIAFYSALLLASLALFANRWLMLMVMILSLLGVMYSTVFKSFTKKVPGFKNVFTSGVWAFGCTFGILCYSPMPVDAFFGLAFLFIFMRSLGNVIFFDLKDIRSDAAEGLRTLPVLLGQKRTIKLLRVISLASFLPLIAGVLLQKMPPYTLSMVVLTAFTFYYLSRAGGDGSRRTGYAHYALADAETMLWPAILLIGKAIYVAI